MAPKSRLTQTRAERDAAAFDAFVEAVEDRLANLVQAHNILDGRMEQMHYMLLFAMQRIRVRQPIASGLIVGTGQPTFEEATLYEFFLKDGPAFIAQLKEQADALAHTLADAQAQASDVSDAPDGPTLATIEGLAASRTSRTRH